MSVDQTPLPSYMNRLLEILVEEELESEADGVTGAVGPCMEYMLQHRILDTMYTFARTDVCVISHVIYFVNAFITVFLHHVTALSSSECSCGRQLSASLVSGCDCTMCSLSVADHMKLLSLLLLLFSPSPPIDNI